MLSQASLAGVSISSKDEISQGQEWVSLPQDSEYLPLARAGWAQGGSFAELLA